MPFYQGTDYQTLNKGLRHFESTSIPVGGENTRSVITGHSGVQNQVLFTDVLALKEGDVFFINILG
jgi:sortase A